MRKTNYMRFVSIFLVLLLIAGCIYQVAITEKSEPKNTLTNETSKLNIEVFSAGSPDKTPTPPPEHSQTPEPEQSPTPSPEHTQTPEPEQSPTPPPEHIQTPEPEDLDKVTDAPQNKNNALKENPLPSTETPKCSDSETQAPGENGQSVPSTQDPDYDNPAAPTLLPEQTMTPSVEQPGNGTPDETEDGLITDLYSRIVTTSELTNNTFTFYVYYSDPAVDANISVNYRHDTDSSNGIYLTPNGINYEVRLTLGINHIVVFYNDAAGTRRAARYLITYEAEKANASQPTIGEKPPVIKTNLDDWTGTIKTRSFTFIVDAKTANGKRIYENNLQVWMDGALIIRPTGSGIYEYTLYFPEPNNGDSEDHHISVLAWDGDGNSSYIEYTVTFENSADGDCIGTVHVVLDATTIGCGILDEIDLELIQGEAASVSILKMLEACGYTCDYAGTTDVGFYLRSITRTDAFYGASINEALLALLERDGIPLSKPCSNDRLSEYDFTMASGFMYSINNTLFPGKGMSEWYLNDGDTLYIRYTLSYGKDIGGSITGYGSLTNYCGKWINDEFIALEHDYVETAHHDATEKEGAYTEYRCSRCAHTKKEYDK